MIFPPLEILYEDNHIVAVNKRASDIVQADKTEDKPLVDRVREYIEEKYDKPGKAFVGVIHRIDRPVSGVILFGKTSKGVARMSELFHDRSVKKTYWAIVKKKPNPESGTLIHYLTKNSERNKSYASDTEKEGASRAWLDYKLLAASDRYFLVEVNPHTGRHHQIRVQLNTIGCTIKGDVKYGYDRPNEGGFIHLHARQIEFIHPVSKKEIKIIAPVPNDPLWKFFEEKINKNEAAVNVQEASSNNRDVLPG